MNRPSLLTRIQSVTTSMWAEALTYTTDSPDEAEADALIPTSDSSSPVEQHPSLPPAAVQPALQTPNDLQAREPLDRVALPPLTRLVRPHFDPVDAEPFAATMLSPQESEASSSLQHSRSHNAPSPEPNPPLAAMCHVRHYCDEAYLPELADHLQAHVNKRLDYLRKQSKTTRVSADADLRNVNGFLLDVKPQRGRRLLADIERIPGEPLRLAIDQWKTAEIPVNVDRHGLYLRRPDLFSNHYRPPTRGASSEPEQPPLNAQNSDPSVLAVTAPFPSADNIFLHHPNASPPPPDVSVSTLPMPRLDDEVIRFTLPSRAGLDLSTNNGSGYVIPKIEEPDDAFLLHPENGNPEPETQENNEVEYNGSDGDTDIVSDRDTPGPSRTRNTAATLRSLAATTSRIGEVGTGLRTMAELSFCLSEVEASPLRRQRSLSVDSTWSTSTDSFLSSVRETLEEGLLTTLASIIHVSLPDDTYGWQWLSPQEAAEIVDRNSAARPGRPSASEMQQGVLEGLFEARGLKGWDCYFWGRRQMHARGREAKSVRVNGEQAYLKNCWDPLHELGTVSMLMVVQPPWALPLMSFEDFTQTQEFTDGVRGEDTFTATEALWAAIYDACQRLNIQHFAVSSYNHVALGYFSSNYQTAFVTSPMSATRSVPDNRPSATDNEKPLGPIPPILYWMRNSMGSFSGSWLIADGAGVTAPVKGGPPIVAEFWKEKLWTPRETSTGGPSDPVVQDKMEELLGDVDTGDADDLDAPFVPTRQAQLAQMEDVRALHDNATPQLLGRGVKRTFADRREGGPTLLREVGMDYILGSGPRDAAQPGSPRVIGIYPTVYLSDDEAAAAKRRKIVKGKSRRKTAGDASDPLLEAGSVFGPLDADVRSQQHLDYRSDEEEPCNVGPRLHIPSTPPGRRSSLIVDTAADDDFVAVQEERYQTPFPVYRDTANNLYAPLGKHLVQYTGQTDSDPDALLTPSYTETDTDTGTDSTASLMTPVDDAGPSSSLGKRPYRSCRGRTPSLPSRPFQMPTPTPTPPPMSYYSPMKGSRYARGKSVAFAEDDLMELDRQADTEATLQSYPTTRLRSRSISRMTPLPEYPSTPSSLRRRSTRKVTAPARLILGHDDREKTPTPLLGHRRPRPIAHDEDSSDEDDDDCDETPAPPSARKRRRTSGIPFVLIERPPRRGVSVSR